LLRDVAEVSGKSLKKYFRKRSIKVLAGCAPCQRFSSYTQKKSRLNRKRWQLLDSFTRIALELKPEIITMENVPGLARERRFKTFLKTLESAGYSTWHDVVECSEYGLPQRRQRIVVLASRLGPLQLLSPKQFQAKTRTVRTTIAKLPNVAAGYSDRADPLHRASSLSPINLQRIRASRPGGTWRDWPQDLVLPCHRKASGAG
jgi:DNA (cytosine-5)-methyltransferase 1